MATDADVAEAIRLQYRAPGFIRWRISVQSSRADGYAREAALYAERASALAASIETRALAERANEAARHAARYAGIATDEYTRCRAGFVGDHSRAFDAQRTGAEWCAEAAELLSRIVELRRAN